MTSLLDVSILLGGFLLTFEVGGRIGFHQRAIPFFGDSPNKRLTNERVVIAPARGDNEKAMNAAFGGLVGRVTRHCQKDSRDQSKKAEVHHLRFSYGLKANNPTQLLISGILVGEFKAVVNGAACDWFAGFAKIACMTMQNATRFAPPRRPAR
jgi:hypothetical protein